MPGKPKTISAICESCKSEFQAHKTRHEQGRHRFCSVACRQQSQRKQVDVQCSYCAAPLKRNPKKSKTCMFFCNNDCKYAAARDESISYRTGPIGKGDARAKAYRTRALRHYQHKCAQCGFDAHVALLDCDHIDSDRSNGNIENLQLLCVMCHAIKTRHVPILFEWACNSEVRVPAL